ERSRTALSVALTRPVVGWFDRRTFGRESSALSPHVPSDAPLVVGGCFLGLHRIAVPFPEAIWHRRPPSSVSPDPVSARPCQVDPSGRCLPRSSASAPEEVPSARPA